MLIDIATMKGVASDRAERWIAAGVLAVLTQRGHKYVSNAQLKRLEKLADFIDESPDGPAAGLFKSEGDIRIDFYTALTKIEKDEDAVPGIEVGLQLLPKILESIGPVPSGSPLDFIDIPGMTVRIATRNPGVAKGVGALTHRFLAARERRAIHFARSANYMGTKATLSPALCEVATDIVGPEGVIVDLMCGSGASAGAFAQHHPRWPPQTPPPVAGSNSSPRLAGRGDFSGV